MSNDRNWTGERLETFITNETMLEHLHRYAITMQLVKGKKVLDIACGEGYGTNLLAKSATHVTGIDIDTTTIEKARKKYNAPNLSFESGSLLQIPAKAESYDIVTCFETLEHVSDHPLAFTELKRVMVPGGILIISTPEKAEYSDKVGYKNPFHQKELYGNEFKELVKRFFKFTFFCKQNCFAASLIQYELSHEVKNFFTGSYEHIEPAPFVEPLYWIALASDNELQTPDSSIFLQQKNISQLLYDHTEAIKKTITYRIGNSILSPFKFIRSLLRK